MNLERLTACAICFETLAESSDGDHTVFRHPVADKLHEVVPVDAARLSVVINGCHICSDELPIWNYRTGLVQVLELVSGVMQTYNDQWHVCYQCAQFIEANDVHGLTAHSAGLVGWRPGSDEYMQISVLHRGILLGREGRTLLTTSPWPPARITATMLPKIRDRFTGLLRSDAGLPAPINASVFRQRLAEQLDTVALYWINEEFTATVGAVSGDQPAARITEDIAPSPAGLVVWSQPVGANGRLAAVSWTPDADGWQLIGYRSIGGALSEELMPHLRHEIGWLLPVHAEHIARRASIDGGHPLAPLITTWLLIKQEIGEAIPAKLPKGTAKAYQRSKRAAPDVRIVRIKPRRASEPSRQPDPAANRTRAKPDHRYWVSGHERQQAYGPGRSLRRAVDIEPFLKGDESLPIKLSTTVRILGRRAERNASSNNE
jgi:hypothetical protein